MSFNVDDMIANAKIETTGGEFLQIFANQSAAVLSEAVVGGRISEELAEKIYSIVGDIGARVTFKLTGLGESDG